MGPAGVAVLDEATTFLVSLTLGSLNVTVWILLKELHVFFFARITPYHDKYLKMFFFKLEKELFPKRNL